MQNYEIVRKSF